MKVFTDTVFLVRNYFCLELYKLFCTTTCNTIYKTLLKIHASSVLVLVWTNKQKLCKKSNQNKQFKPHRIITREIWLFIDVFYLNTHWVLFSRFCVNKFAKTKFSLVLSSWSLNFCILYLVMVSFDEASLLEHWNVIIQCSVLRA